jgi:hypothetical protein
MAVAPPFQLRQHDLMPYVTVGTDMRGSAIWIVVDRDIVIECPSGERAVRVMEHLILTKHRT